MSSPADLGAFRKPLPIQVGWPCPARRRLSPAPGGGCSGLQSGGHLPCTPRARPCGRGSRRPAERKAPGSSGAHSAVRGPIRQRPLRSPWCGALRGAGGRASATESGNPMRRGRVSGPGERSRRAPACPCPLQTHQEAGLGLAHGHCSAPGACGRDKGRLLITCAPRSTPAPSSSGKPPLSSPGSPPDFQLLIARWTYPFPHQKSVSPLGSSHAPVVVPQLVCPTLQ